MSSLLFLHLFLGLFGLKILIKLVLNLLNLIHLKRKAGQIPGPIAGLVDHSQLRRIDSYNADKMCFQTIVFLADTLLLLGFLFTPLYAGYTGWVQSLPWPGLAKGLLFFLLINWTLWALELPFSFYFHFVIESRYGFNKYSPGEWWTDNLKSWLMNTVLTVVVLGLILALWGDRTAFTVTDILVGWGIIFGLTVLFMYLVPVLFIPFFYKLTPLPDGPLKERITALVGQTGFTIRGIFMADESRKSGHANAQFAGFGRNKTIILFDNLVDHYTDEEILAVLAHEIGHGKKKHLLKLMLMVLVESLLFLVFAFYLLTADFTFQAFAIPKLFYSGLFITYVFFFDVLSFYIMPFSSRFSRKLEYEADAFSRKLIGTAGPLVSVFKKFIVNELDNINPHPLYEAFYYSHPTLWKRIKALES
ncbi:STE24 endopeptidase [Hydrogenispora ethanolica]|jgi:STE24 endopeptidase|uniref:STE24 endopeptidase n=1 Tax=Hydrogenispora ethanolica TaxID=1082276 RepID=A0A4R1RGX6_HYDET|nr:M48 family metallopeptidase [Hydrogenispora ethanolica]TCL65308.1 STE24 endopeptidase [Hydrogenispora ethanolica]